MEKGLLYRILLVGGILFIALLSLVPTLNYDYTSNESSLPRWWQESGILPSHNLVLGLDLQGGMDLVVSVNVEEAVVSELRHYQELMEDFMKRDKKDYSRIEVDPGQRRILIEFPDADAMHEGTTYINKYFTDLVIAGDKDTLHPVYKIREAVINRILNQAVEQVKEVLARRMDSFGLKEPEIVVQGDNRIRLQLPGVKDPTRIKKNIKRSAKLEFMLVETVGRSRESAEQASGGPPAGFSLANWTDSTNPEKRVECYFPDTSEVGEGAVKVNRRLVLGVERTGDESKDACYLLREDLTVSGADLKDARPGYDPDQFQGSVVNFEFNMKGAQKFAKVTGEHINEFLAIVLEDQVVSAPRIQSKIFNRGQITGAFTPEEASDLANVLRSGALEVSILIEEERTVGASLGADSIEKGKVAIFWGAVIVVFFMVVYYRLAGLIADLALVLNLVFIMAMLSLFGATLTLPGLAGIVLTVGMAVDANVLIFERVREELRTGKTPQASVDAGYAKALWTILDANITTVIAALVLMQWGTGPIKGFAVTLTLGIASSLFTAIVFTRVIYDLIFQYLKGASLSIGIKLQPTADPGKGVK